jgi:lipopolysaccharide/colanic/teichoic acid biosynthesis glycosyltransferase
MSLVWAPPFLVQHPIATRPNRRGVMKCGLAWTGWAQVNGRNAVTWEDKF